MRSNADGLGTHGRKMNVQNVHMSGLAQTKLMQKRSGF